jgi:hypothetical protein
MSNLNVTVRPIPQLDCFIIISDAEGAIPQLDFTLSDAPLSEAPNKITSSSNININETGEGVIFVHISKEKSLGLFN